MTHPGSRQAIQTGTLANEEAVTQRANQLYHDFQTTAFDEIHRRRHAVERVFWETHVATRLRRHNARLGESIFVVGWASCRPSLCRRPKRHRRWWSGGSSPVAGQHSIDRNTLMD